MYTAISRASAFFLTSVILFLGACSQEQREANSAAMIERMFPDPAIRPALFSAMPFDDAALVYFYPEMTNTNEVLQHLAYFCNTNVPGSTPMQHEKWPPEPDSAKKDGRPLIKFWVSCKK